MTTAPASCGDVQCIADDQRLWRATRAGADDLVWLGGKDGRWAPAPNPPSIQFHKDPDDPKAREMSAAWREHLEGEHDMGPESVLKDKPSYTLVWEVGAGEARSLKFTVIHTPPGSTPVECAHASIYLPYGATRDVRRDMESSISKAVTHVLGELPPTGPPDA